MASNSEAVLRDRIAELEEENRQLRHTQAPESSRLQIHFNITRTEARILAALSRGGIQSRGKLLDLACRDDTAPDTINVHVTKLRRKIAPLQIKNAWGSGYFLEGESLAAIRAIIKPNTEAEQCRADQ